MDPWRRRILLMETNNVESSLEPTLSTFALAPSIYSAGTSSFAVPRAKEESMTEESLSNLHFPNQRTERMETNSASYHQSLILPLTLLHLHCWASGTRFVFQFSAPKTEKRGDNWLVNVSHLWFINFGAIPLNMPFESAALPPLSCLIPAWLDQDAMHRSTHGEWNMECS